MSDNIFTKTPDLKYSEEMKEVSFEAFEDILQNRRSVRQYTDEKIPAHIVEKV